MKLVKGKVSKNSRESFNCNNCQATARERAVILGVKKARRRFPFRAFGKQVRILGVSDSERTQAAFKRQYDSRYTNFHFHKEPFLDIAHVDDEFESIADVISCSDVLNYVEPPLDRAFESLFKLLKPGGYLVVSVPHSPSGQLHVEHFPVMRNMKIKLEPTPELTGEDAEGNLHSYQDLKFGEGDGVNLEYRVFSEDSLKANLAAAGFVNIRTVPNSRLYGIFWEPWSRVWIAERI
jgi:SAM-dependent methyltransferase